MGKIHRTAVMEELGRAVALMAGEGLDGFAAALGHAPLSSVQCGDDTISIGPWLEAPSATHRNAFLRHGDGSATLIEIVYDHEEPGPVAEFVQFDPEAFKWLVGELRS